MRVPLSWLRDYVDIDLSPEQLAERLTLLGMEVKWIERWGSDWRNVVVGELLTVEKHPRADRLSLTTVSLGDGSAPLEIVCGATNIAPGQRVPVALPGAVLPGDRRIERTEKMGVVSNGMLCSGDELNLTGDADGILILAAETPLGAALTDVYGDVVLDIDVKPNRGDALSLVGLAREVAAIDGQPIRFPETAPAESGSAIDGLLAVDVRDPDLCPRFVGRWVDGVRVGPAPDRVQMRLRAAGVRPISNVVDASNYVMLELGKPVHAFDAAAVGGGERPRRLIVRRAEARRATRDARPRRARARTRTRSSSRNPSGPLAHRRGHGRRVVGGEARRRPRSSSSRPSSTRSAFVGRASATASAPRRVCVSRRARSSGWRGSARTGPRGSSPSGPAARLPAAASTPPRTSRRPLASHSAPARVNRLLGDDVNADEQRRLLARVGVETAPAPPDGPDHRLGRPEAVDRARRRGDGGVRRDRPDLAPRHRDRSRPRRGGRPRPWLRPDTGHPAATRRCPRTGIRRSRSATPIRETLVGGGPDRGRHPRPRLAAHRRDLPLGSGRCPRSRVAAPKVVAGS